MKKIKIATRASKLALTQSGHVRDMLKGVCPEAEIELVNISTKGDRDQSDFLYKVGTMGFFTTEVENALLDGRADVAVHSLKDLPTEIRAGLVVAAMPVRESVCDTLITKDGATSIADLPEGATVGTSSLRRIAQVKHARTDLECVPMRGNVETRVRKVQEGEVDAIIIAHAGLNRLGMGDAVSAVLDPTEFIPAPAQGALGVQIRGCDLELMEIVSKLDNKETRITAETERHILSAMHGGCSIPLGVHAVIDGDRIVIYAMISDVEGKNFISFKETAAISDAKSLAEELAGRLLDSGGREILNDIRQSRE